MKKIFLSIIVLVMVFSSIGNNLVKAEPNIETRVENLLSTMTLEQKVGQMLQPDTRSITPQEVKENYIGSILSGGGASPSTGNTAQDWANRLDAYQEAAITGYGIPLLYGVDAVHGHNNVLNATIFPHNIGLGQADDEDLMQRIAQITAKEMRATGANWTFSPTLGLPKNELWGRTYECFGEDADLVSRLAAAYVEGSQGDLGATSAIATGKHFVAEGITSGGVNQGNVDMAYDSAEFQEILHNELLVPYQEVINSGVKSIMISYNSIDGVKCHGNYNLITTLLKGELGFDGIVISDYNGIDQIEGNLTYQQKAIKAVNAGIDMLMVDGYEGSTPKWLLVKNAIINAVTSGEISMDRIDDAVRRILTVKFEMGLMDDVSLAYSNSSLLAQVGSAEHREVAKEAVRKSLTLLKNTATQNGSSTIMLDLATMDRIIVAGSAADNIGIQCGGWTISWQGSTGAITEGTTILQGLKETASAGTVIDYSANGYFSEDYQAAIVVVGETPYAEYAGDRSASELKLSDSDIQTIDRIKRDHPELPIILVLVTGRPITIANQVDDVDAIVMAGFPGSEGAGVAEVLLGSYDFTGNLTVTWPWYAQDIEEKLTDDSKVLFAYGRGLSKSETTAIETVMPEDPTVVDLAATGGILEAENYIAKHSGIQLENNGTSIGYFWEGYDISYRVQVPESARYTLILNTATQNASVPVALDIYVDGKLYYSQTTPLSNTGGWSVFKDLEMPELISLPEGIHEIKFVSKSRDFNVDKFKFIKFDDNYQEPEDPQDNVGTGAMIKEAAVEVIMSSSDNSQSMSWYAGDQEIENKNEQQASLDIRNADSSNLTTIVINDDEEYQEVLGLGISIEESTVNNMLKMSDETRHEFIKQLIDPETGMGNSLIRVTIGTADFTGQDFYTYYDGTGTELGGLPDWQNVTGLGFSIQKDYDYGIIQIINEIQEVAKEVGVEDQLRFFASSWTPPGWMKTATTSSNSYPNNSLLLKGGKLSDEHIKDLATYYVRYIEEYKKAGIPIYAMTLQNEPLLEIDYPSCYITATQEAKLAKAIKEQLAASSVLNEQEKDVKVWAFDHNFDGAQSYVDELLATADGRDNIDGIAFHPYGGVPSTMGSLYETYKDQYTMHLTERSVWGVQGASDIISWFRNGSQSYNAWVTMLDSKISPHQWVGTPDPTLFVLDAYNSERYWATPEVYIIGQFTKYVRPGYVRISSNNDSSIANVAFKDPESGKIVLIVANRSATSQDFKVVLDGTQFNATLPAGNVATYIWDPVDSTSFKNITDDLTFQDATLSGSGVIENDELGYIDSTTSLEYLVNVKEAGSYKVTFEVATGASWDTDYPVVISQGGNQLGQATIRRYVWWGNEWSSYSTIQTYVTFEEAGLQSFTLTFPQGGMNFKDVHFVREEAVQSIPGILDTENYLHAKGLVHEKGNPANFGFIDFDDYIDYQVNVQVTGDYEFSFEVGTDTAGGVWIDSISEDGTVTYIGEVNFPVTGSNSTYQYISGLLHLTAGEQTLRIKFKNSGVNFRQVVVGQGIKITQTELIEGSLQGKQVVVELFNASFVDTLNKENWHLNLPTGVDFTIERIDDTKVMITFISEASVDFDIDQLVTCEVSATEYNGMLDTSVQATILIKAIDDPEILEMAASLTYGQEEVTITINGGTFRENIEDYLTLTGSISKYVSIDSVEYVSPTRVNVKLSWQLFYGDTYGTFNVLADGYDDGTLTLAIQTLFEATDQLPEAIIIENDPVVLAEEVSYRNEGSLKNNPSKGNYIDFYLDVKEAGNYVITYKVKDDEAISNALKISGGLGLATNNLMSVSFGKFWSNTLEYRTMLSLAQGEQTLRFEVNNSGFSINQIIIEKFIEPVVVNETTIIAVDDLVDGSKSKGWGIETKNGILNVGCGESGAYQDYIVDVKKSGKYSFSIHSGGNSGNIPEAVLQLVNGSNVQELGRVAATKTGNWDSFQDSESIEVFLEAGVQTLRIYDDIDGFNYRSFTLTLIEEFDVTAPQISGINAIVYTNNSLDIKEIIELLVIDNINGDITLDAEKVTITTTYDATKAGIYGVLVVAKDEAGNIASAEFTISVVNPAILLYNTSQISKGSSFDPLEGIKVIDVDGQDITNKVKVIENTVDTTSVGSYYVIYEVVDALGTRTTFKRLVEVIEGIVEPDPDPIPDPDPTPDPDPIPDPDPTPNPNPGQIDGTPDQGKVDVTPPTADSTNNISYVIVLAVALLLLIQLLYKKKFNYHIVKEEE